MGASTPTLHCSPKAKAQFFVDKELKPSFSSEQSGGAILSLKRPGWFWPEPKPGSSHLETAAAALAEPRKRRVHPLNSSRNPGKVPATAPDSRFSVMRESNGTSKHHQTLWGCETTPQWSDDRLMTASFAAQHLEFFPPTVYAHHHLS